MVDDFKYDVFLSHSAKDKDVVRSIAERLRASGLRVWLEEWKIEQRATKALRARKIEYGLEFSRALVLCMSADAFGSEWVQLEAGTFRFRDPLNKDRRFIPLRLDQAPIQGSLAQLSFIDWSPEDREQKYAKLLEACLLPAKSKAVLRRLARNQPAENAIQLNYKRRIWAYSFSPDRKYVLTGDEDNALRLWDLETGRFQFVMRGHTDWVNSAVWSADQRLALSGSGDTTMRLWDIETGACLRVFEGHTKAVLSVAWSVDQRRALSASEDKTMRLWDLETGRCLLTLAGHTSYVTSAEWSTDERRALSGSYDNTVRLWDLETGYCLRVFEGHAGIVWSVPWSVDQRQALSCSYDFTVRLWDLETGRCLRVFEGHTNQVHCVVWSSDQRYVLSGSGDQTLRLWDIETGRCLRVLKGHTSAIGTVEWSPGRCRAYSGDINGGIRVWDLSEFVIEALAPEALAPALAPGLDQVQYTNAKVLLVGESGAGKTGLTERLAHDSFTPSYSTSGTWSTQWQMKDLPPESGWEREVWLWDFGGQADQRLIHQLYLDNTALVLLVFNADRAVVVPGLCEWQQALSRSVPGDTRTFLVAGRIDVGLRFDREKVRTFAKQHSYDYFETSANDGRGCAALRRSIQTGIPWALLERRTSPPIFKLLKDEILKLRDNGEVLFTFKELRETLRQHLSIQTRFTDADLETVVSLLDGPGVVKELSFGTYILLRPEWINVYAQAVIRTLRAEERNLGCLTVRSIATGKLIFQTQQASGEIVEEKRLGAREEPIVLQVMEQMLLERRLCVQQQGNLVFPSYCGVEKPIGPVPPKYFISYVFGGFLDDIYATLVVKLVYCGAFKLKELWRDAADFETLAERRAMGIKLLRNDDGRGTLLVHFGKGVPPQEQVIFANYIHEHLFERATEPQRLRFHVCPHCDTAVKDREEAMRRLDEDGDQASILCVRCERRVPLWDSLENHFASDTAKKKVALLQAQERIELDSRRKGKLLALEVGARITSADQKCFEIPGVEDEGLDMEVEFTDADGKGTGKRLYLQLKAGNSHLERPRSDGPEVFRIKKQSWVKYWLQQDRPVLLVIGTFPAEDDLRGGSKERFADIRWMEIGDLLRRRSDNGRKRVWRIDFQGETLDTMSVRRWRDRTLAQAVL